MEPNLAELRPQNLSPGQHPFHQGPHAQLAGDGQGLVQQGHGLLAVARLVALKQRVGLVAAGPSQIGSVARLAAECQGVFKVGRRLVQIAQNCLPLLTPVSSFFSYGYVVIHGHNFAFADIPLPT